MAYTPELSNRSCCTLRRLAWAMGRPMTTTIEEVFMYMGKVADKKMVCQACKDKSKCKQCYFSHKSSAPEIKK